MDPRVVAALIGAGAGLVVLLLKEYVLDPIRGAISHRRTQMMVFRAYAQPLVDSGERVYERLRALHKSPENAHYVRAPRSEFARYKYISSAYRIGALIAWKEALKRESRDILRKRRSKTTRIYKALMSLESSFADGQHVEKLRMDLVCNRWGIQGVPARLRHRIESAIDNALQLHVSSREDLSLHSLEPSQLREVFARIQADFQSIAEISVTDEIVQETEQKLANELSLQESYLYRDWHDGIAEVFLKPSSSLVRRYDVIGFASFESLIRSGDEEACLWAMRISGLFNNLSDDDSPTQDTRVQLLRKVFDALGELLIALDGFERGLVTERTLEFAKVRKASSKQTQ